MSCENMKGFPWGQYTPRDDLESIFWIIIERAVGYQGSTMEEDTLEGIRKGYGFEHDDGFDDIMRNLKFEYSGYEPTIGKLRGFFSPHHLELLRSNGWEQYFRKERHFPQWKHMVNLQNGTVEARMTSSSQSSRPATKLCAQRCSLARPNKMARR